METNEFDERPEWLQKLTQPPPSTGDAIAALEQIIEAQGERIEDLGAMTQTVLEMVQNTIDAMTSDLNARLLKLEERTLAHE